MPARPVLLGASGAWSTNRHRTAEQATAPSTRRTFPPIIPTMDDDISQMIYNFSAGPAVLPVPVLKRAQEELPDWHGTGMSVMEMSHRGSDFVRIAETAEARLRELMAIPGDYRVLFLQGGATGQFAAVPMNLSSQDAVADYVITGMWGKRAHAEGSKFLDRVNVAASSPGTFVPTQDEWRLNADADYVHITLNET